MNDKTINYSHIMKIYPRIPYKMVYSSNNNVLDEYEKWVGKITMLKKSINERTIGNSLYGKSRFEGTLYNERELSEVNERLDDIIMTIWSYEMIVVIIDIIRGKADLIDTLQLNERKIVRAYLCLPN